MTAAPTRTTTTTVPPTPPPTARVLLAPARARQAVLDGGWWPRSTDPATELPDLVLALDERFGPIRQLMLNSHTWDARPRRLAVGARLLRIGWFASVDPALTIATTEHGDQLDIMVVPAGTSEAAARGAMARAAEPTNTMRAAEILAAIPAAGGTAADRDAGSVWDNEGGLVGHRPRRPVNGHPSVVAR